MKKKLQIYHPQISLTGIITYTVREAIKSSLVKFKPALILVKLPDLVSKETSVPAAKRLVPITPEKLTVGF